MTKLVIRRGEASRGGSAVLEWIAAAGPPDTRMSRLHPFEYMAWAKQVPAGARYPLHVSGLAPPDPPASMRLPDWEAWTAPPAALRDALVPALLGYIGAPDSDLLIVSGASEAIFVALAAHLQPGDPVLIERPAYAAFERGLHFLGGSPRVLERRPEDRWRLDPRALAGHLAQTGARLIAITDPLNPTGTSVDPATRQAIVAAAEQSGALLVVDETFAPFRGPERPPAWAAASDRVLSLGSLTKGWGLSAIRIGWIAGEPSLIAACARFFDLLGVNPPSATLAFAREALRCAADLDRRAARASARFKAVIAATGWDERAIVPPDDGIIGFLRLPPAFTSDVAARALRTRDGVQVAPGHYFGRDDFIRIGFDPETTDGAAACRLISARLT